MNPLRHFISVLPLVCLPFLVNAQLTISGRVLDGGDSSAVAFVTVVLTPYGMPTILGFDQTDDKGEYSIKLREHTPHDIEIRTSSLGYAVTTQRLLLDSVGGDSITLPLVIYPTGTDLTTVEIKAERPIRISGDTIVYDFEHFTSLRDDDLEDVFRRLPGFEIGPDGLIYVNGQLIRKLLVNGEEMPTSDPAMLAKALPADFVTKLAVRFDERDRRIKENSLDGDPFAVIDVELKEGISLDLFGKGVLSLGAGERVAPGGHGNAFSLSKRVRWHFFADHDQFGDEQIDLMMLENIGEASFSDQFEESDNIADYANSEGYQNGIFGYLKYFERRERSVAGVAAKLPLQKADLYVGTYNYLDRIGRSSTDELRTLNETVFNWREASTERRLSSFNKIDYRLHGTAVGLRASAGYNLDDFRNQHLTTEVLTGYRFANDATPQRSVGYVNARADFPVRQGNELSLRHESAYRSEHLRDDRQSTDTILAHQLFGIFLPAFDFRTNSGRNGWRHDTELTAVRTLSKLFSLRLNAQLNTVSERRQTDAVAATATELLPTPTAFTLAPTFRQQHMARMAAGLRYRQKAWRIDGQVGQVVTFHPWAGQQYHNLTLNATARYKATGYDHLEIIYERRPGLFALGNFFEETALIGNQLLQEGVPTGLSPTNNTRVTLSAGKYFHGPGLRLSTYSNYYRTFNGMVFNAPTAGSALITQSVGQQLNDLAQLSLRVVKQFANSGWKAQLHPGLISYRTPLATEGGKSDFITGINFSLALELTYDQADRPWSIKIEPKYTYFNTATRSGGSLGEQRLWWANLTWQRSLLSERLLIGAEATAFTTGQQGNGSGLLCNLQLTLPGTLQRWQFAVENIFDVRSLRRNDFSPFQWRSTDTSMLGRFAKISGTFKFH